MRKTAGHLDIRLFGHLEVTLDGARFKLATPRKSLQVLAYLLLHRDAPVSRKATASIRYPAARSAGPNARARLPAPIKVTVGRRAFLRLAIVFARITKIAELARDRRHPTPARATTHGLGTPVIADIWVRRNSDKVTDFQPPRDSKGFRSRR